MRKLLIGLISLAIVLSAYLLYNRLSRMPPIDSHPAAEFVEAVADGNMGGLEDEMGKIGDVGIGPVRKAKYVILNKDKEVEREFGFEKLLHEVRDIWEIQKPYMNIYRRSFECYITADRGKVQVETAVGKTTPKDATFTGNVVVHIVPKDSKSIKESFVYLDEVIFLSDRSQLATGGPIRFVSEDAQMKGTGMEFVYNDQTERLEYFRIVDLESLRMRVKSLQKTFVAGGDDKQPEKPADTAAGPETKQPNQPVVAAAPQRAQAPPRPAPQQVEPAQGEYYKCILSKNVVVDSPEQLVFAEEQLCINKIFWSKASDSGSGKADAGGPDDARKTAAAAQVPQSADNAKAQEITVSGRGEPNEPSEQFIDVVVTCDGGVLLVPMDSARAPEDSAEDVAASAGSDSKVSTLLDDDTERTKFFTRRIDYDASTGDAVATGLSELTFYASPVFQSKSKAAAETPGATAADANETPVAVTIVAREGAKFFDAANQVIFEGNCLCTMPQGGLSEQKSATFSAPNIIVNVPQDKTKQPDILAAGPAELVFYMQDSNDTGAAKEPLPVRISAQRQARFLPASNQIIFEGDCLCTMPQKGLVPAQDCIVSSPQFTIQLPKDKSKQPDIFAAGPAELTFYAQPALQKGPKAMTQADDSTVSEGKRAPLPAKLTAQRQVRFLGSSNQIVFEGDCRYSMVQEDPNAVVTYMVSAYQIALDLPEDTNDPASGSTADIERLTASGGTVKLSALRRAGQKLLGGVELECVKFDYDADRQVFVWTGPGVMNFYNSGRSDSNEPAGQFSLRKPCWAFLRDFDTVKYFLQTNRIVAEAGAQRLLIDYFPVVDGRYDEHFKAVASHMEALLTETPEGRTELSTLIASGGIDYEDDRNVFVGSELLYDHEKSLIKVSGDTSRPCYLNGALVDGIEYDLINREVKAEWIGPGALKINR